MSNPFKAIGKVFKAVGKFVMKVAPFALAAAAVIFTGGAALGILPTFSAAVGGLVSGLGLSAGLTGAITGAITSAGFGSALGFITGGTKGMKKGFLMGALTGGIMGAVNPSTFGIVKSLDAAGNTVVTTTNALAHGGNAFGAAGKGAFSVVKDSATGLYRAVPKAGTIGSSMAAAGGGMTPGPSTHPIANGVDPLAPLPDPLAPLPQTAPAATATTSGMAPAATAAPTAPSVAPPVVPGAEAPAGAASAGGGGGITGMLSNPLIMGNLLQGVGGMLGGGGDTYYDKAKAEMKMGEWAYGGVYSGNSDPFNLRERTYTDMRPRYYYDPVRQMVVDRNQTGG